MKTENVVLMQMARASLKGKWALAIGTFVIYLLIGIPLQFIPIIGGFGWLILAGPFSLGLAIFSLNIARNQDARLEQLFDGFKNFANALATYLLMALFVFLWMLLLIVPGIIAAISYALTFYILADEPNIGPMAAIDKSKQLMYGYKMKYFCLGLRFFGLALLCLLTLGIGFFWLMPYMQVTMAYFYEDVKANSIVVNPIDNATNVVEDI